MDVATFRSYYPEFGDAVAFPDPAIQRFLDFGAKQLNAERWADMLDEGLGLFAAHSLTVATRNKKSAGSMLAPVTSKAVDKVSVSYDVAAVTLADGGYWNQTSYGVQLLTWARMVGAGGVQL